MSDDTAASRETARISLLRWAEPLDSWIRWIIDEVVATGRPLGDAGLDEAYRRLLAEKGLSEETFASPAAVGGGVASDSSSQALALRTLSDCSGVNALAPAQAITFNPKMTVLFGENASGKSGYVRILKRLADVRSVETVLGDVYGSSSVAPSAVVEYSLGDEVRELQWHDEQGVAPFTRMGIFDSQAMSIHLDTDLTYVFTPADLALFNYAHAAVDAVRGRADAAAREAQPRANPFLPRFQRGTEAYRLVEALAASSDLAAIDALAQVPDDVDEELARRRARVEALRPETVAARLEIARGDRRLHEAILQLCERGREFEVAGYTAAIEEAARADED
jgi:hypothetical protein